MDPAVLLIDDEPDYLTTYADTLRPYGFEPVGVSTREEAILALDARRWDVIVLDERLRGPGSEHGAPALLAEIAARSPSARTIVLTAFATDDSVRRAIAAGAWDYLEKDARFLEHLLPLRVRHAAEMARQRRGMTPDERERALRDTWTSALSEQNAQRKGRLLEEALELLFVGTPGLTEVARNRRSSNEEFDLVVTNASTDPVLAKEGSFILVECKNWSTRGRSEGAR
jgi:DNA-binding NtrC family response regulator